MTPAPILSSATSLHDDSGAAQHREGKQAKKTSKHERTSLFRVCALFIDK
ncbi:MAG: hypothetical protein IPP47_20730 [Bryobacterales bacterium]|nr:hypothetical protein [Bryobacterales bacterium]